jgi:hypothetical protein
VLVDSCFPIFGLNLVPLSDTVEGHKKNFFLDSSTLKMKE